MRKIRMYRVIMQYDVIAYNCTVLATSKKEAFFDAQNDFKRVLKRILDKENYEYAVDGIELLNIEAI